MPRKPTRGYYVKGHFVAEGSELDLQLKAEAKGHHAHSKTERKREMDRLQALGEELLALRADLLHGLALPDKLLDALAEAKRLSDFGARRRQMQFIGKLMRQLDADTVAAVEAALKVQREGSAEEKRALHLAEQWRKRLLEDDAALAEWLAVARQASGEAGAEPDVQHLRTLIRQARKDLQSQPHESLGAAQRHGKAYREIFQLIKAALAAPSA